MVVLAQNAVRRLTVRAQIALGAALLIIGLAALASVVATVGSLAFFFLAGIVTGAGAGILFKASLTVAGGLAETKTRGEVLAGVFLTGYVGLTLPVVGIGVATLSVSLTTALVGFAVAIAAIVLATAIPLLAALQVVNDQTRSPSDGVGI